jgi:hypothetical protein
MASFCRNLLLAVLAAATPADSATAMYRSVAVDSAGRLHIVLESGAEVRPPKLRGQVSFGDPAISPDRRTAGWLVLYPYPGPQGASYRRDPIAGDLVLYRSGRVIHRFRTEQTFWDWRFQDAGRRVAYSTGPTHGGAAVCVLRDVETGQILAEWPVRGGGEPPDWARGLRM